MQQIKVKNMQRSLLLLACATVVQALTGSAPPQSLLKVSAARARTTGEPTFSETPTHIEGRCDVMETIERYSIDNTDNNGIIQFDKIVTLEPILLYTNGHAASSAGYGNLGAIFEYSYVRWNPKNAYVNCSIKNVDFGDHPRRPWHICSGLFLASSIFVDTGFLRTVLRDAEIYSGSIEESEFYGAEINPSELRTAYLGKEVNTFLDRMFEYNPYFKNYTSNQDLIKNVRRALAIAEQIVEHRTTITDSSFTDCTLENVRMSERINLNGSTLIYDSQSDKNSTILDNGRQVDLYRNPLHNYPQNLPPKGAINYAQKNNFILYKLAFSPSINSETVSEILQILNANLAKFGIKFDHLNNQPDIQEYGVIGIEVDNLPGTLVAEVDNIAFFPTYGVITLNSNNVDNKSMLHEVMHKIFGARHWEKDKGPENIQNGYASFLIGQEKVKTDPATLSPSVIEWIKKLVQDDLNIDLSAHISENQPLPLINDRIHYGTNFTISVTERLMNFQKMILGNKVNFEIIDSSDTKTCYSSDKCGAEIKLRENEALFKATVATRLYYLIIGGEQKDVKIEINNLDTGKKETITINTEEAHRQAVNQTPGPAPEPAPAPTPGPAPAPPPRDEEKVNITPPPGTNEEEGYFRDGFLNKLGPIAVYTAAAIGTTCALVYGAIKLKKYQDQRRAAGAAAGVEMAAAGAAALGGVPQPGAAAGAAAGVEMAAAGAAGAAAGAAAGSAVAARQAPMEPNNTGWRGRISSSSSNESHESNMSRISSSSSNESHESNMSVGYV